MRNSFLRNFFLGSLVLLSISGCKNPLGSGDSVVDAGYNAGIPGQDITVTIPFTPGTEASYDISGPPTTVELVSDVARLKAANQADTNNTGTQFGAVPQTNLAWDGAGFLRLDSATNTTELDSSWTPSWNHIVGYWKMNGTVGAIANGATIPATVGTDGVAVKAVGGDLKYISGKMNQGLSFVKGKDVMKVNAALPISNKYTFSFWVYLDNFAATISAPISTSSGGTLTWEIYFNYTYTNGGLVPSYGINIADVPAIKNSGTAANTFTALDLTHWHHIAVVYDTAAVTKTKIYKDGRLLPFGNNNVTTSFPAHNTFWVGGYRGDGNTCCDTNGKTDEVAVWDIPLNATDIEAIYNRQSPAHSAEYKSRVMDAYSVGQKWESISSSTTLPFYKELTSGSETSPDYSAVLGDLTGMEGLWHLNEPSGTTGANVLDKSGHGRNGTPTNASFGVSGKLSSSVYLKGTSLIAIPNATDLNNTGSIITVSAWINTTVANNGKIFSSKDGSKGYQLYVDASGKVAAWSDTGGIFTGNAIVDDGEWHHLTAVWNGARVDLYVDGKPDSSSGAMSFQAQGKDNQIGAECSGASSTTCSSYFDGRIDEVAVWRKVLTDAEVLQLYRRGANRLKYQVRSCANADCSDQDLLTSSGHGWKGPDNSQVSYFSELHNNATINSAGNPTGTVQTGPLKLLFNTFTAAGTGLSVSDNRYFQYRTILESDDKNSLCTYGGSALPCSPELKAITIGPDHYDKTIQTITSKASLGTAYTTLYANGFTETGGTCTAGLHYALSGDGITYYYWNTTAWATSSDYNTASIASDISTNLASFTDLAGAGTLQIKTFLKSDGKTSCQIDKLSVTGKD